MFMSAPPCLAFHGSDIFAFEQDMKARAHQRFDDRRQRKLTVRKGKHTLSSISAQQLGAMASEDWALVGVPDGIQDSFEAQQLRNRYLAGTAGSPYADPDHGVFFQRMQRPDCSLSTKRPVVDHAQSWQSAFGVHDATDIQSMFAPMQFQFEVAAIDGLPMQAPNSMGQGMSTSSLDFAQSDAGTTFGSFSSAGASNLLDSCSFGSADGAAIINSPPDQFAYAKSPFANSSLVPQDLNIIKGGPLTSSPFPEPTPLLFFPAPQEQLAERQCRMEEHQEAKNVDVLKSHGGCNGIKADPLAQHMLVSRPRRELPEQPRSPQAAQSGSFRHRSSQSRKAVTTTRKTELRPKQSKPCPAQVSQLDVAERSAKDEYLLKAKQEGLTYREIRVKGNFTEAESTLRGRYRTLTKSKEARVRKPEWTDKDIHLLHRAVRKFAKSNDPTSTKIPWKLVAEYIQRNGGSYLFGNATCRKKWDELVPGTSGRQTGGLGAAE